MSESERPRVGFIGVGLMGHGLAKNAVEKGYPLTVLVAKPEPAADVVRRGAKAARTPAEAARAGGSRCGEQASLRCCRSLAQALGTSANPSAPVS